MYWNNMSYGVPDFHTPCVIKLKRGKASYVVAAFELFNNEGVWFSHNDVYHVIEVSHWAYITPPNC